jgi:hypothetical protein
MTRVSEISPDALPDDARYIFQRYVTKYGPFENQAKVFAQRPSALRHIMSLLLELADEKVLLKKYLKITPVIKKQRACASVHDQRISSDT